MKNPTKKVGWSLDNHKALFFVSLNLEYESKRNDFGNVYSIVISNNRCLYRCNVQ
jgi:hypothetical protein